MYIAGSPNIQPIQVSQGGSLRNTVLKRESTVFYSILNTEEKGVKNPFNVQIWIKKLIKKITFVHNVYAKTL